MHLLTHLNGTDKRLFHTWHWSENYQIKITHALSGTAMESHPRDHIFLFKTFWPHSELKSQRILGTKIDSGLGRGCLHSQEMAHRGGRVDCFCGEWLPWETSHHHHGPLAAWLSPLHRAASERKECLFQSGLAPLQEEGV